MSGKNKISRRKLLEDTGLILGGSAIAAYFPPLEALGKLMTRGFIDRAQADGGAEKYYLNFGFFGAPGRWVFDHWMRAQHNQEIVSNPMVSTRLVSENGNYSRAIYETVDYKGVPVTPLWMTQVQGANGPRAMSELLDHMIVVRGYGTGIDGHPNNYERQIRPLPSLGSIGGYLSDQTQLTLKAVRYPAHNLSTFASEMGVGIANIHGDSNPNTNLLKTLLYPFGSRGGTLDELQKLRVRYDKVIEESQLVINQALVPAMGAQAVADRSSARKMLQQGMDQLIEQWPALLNKYVTILHTTLKDQTVPGFSDQPVAYPGGNVGLPGNPFFVSIGGGGFSPAPGFDLRNLFDSANMVMVAQSLALSEFIFTNKLAPYMEALAFAPIQGVTGTFTNSFDNSVQQGPTSMQFDFVLDQHVTGAVAMCYLNACFFRACSAGLLELVDQLKKVSHAGGTLFDHTVIHLNQDFGRSPRVAGTGADHGYNNMITSLITGMHKSGPKLLGNISLTGTYGNDYIGTNGFMAPTMLDGKSTLLSPLHVASSLSSLLGLSHNPWGNLASRLFEEKNGQIEFHIGAENL